MKTPLLCLMLCASSVALAAAPPSTAGAKTAVAIPANMFPGEATTVNIVQWDSNELPKIYERSAQLPITDEEVAKLSKAGFDSAQLVKMIEERHCACDASAEGLIKLKNQGVKKEVLSAISLHGLKPNREIDLFINLDFSGEGSQAREGHLYFFVEDGAITRIFTVSIAEMLRRKWAHETMVDQSDLMITRKVRRVQLAGKVPLKRYGKHNVLVVASGNLGLTHPDQLSEAERSKAQTYVFDYPRASIDRMCRLMAAYRRDVVLAHQWNYMGSRFECEWD